MPLDPQLDQAGLFQAIFDKVMDIPEYSNSIYNNWLRDRYGDAVSQFFLQESDTLAELGNNDSSDAGQTFEDFLLAAKSAGSDFGYNSSDRLNQLASLSGVGMNELRTEFDGFAGSGISFDQLQGRAVSNSLRRNFGGGLERGAARKFFDPRARGDYLLSSAEVEPEGFLRQRVADLRSRYGL